MMNDYKLDRLVGRDPLPEDQVAFDRVSNLFARARRLSTDQNFSLTCEVNMLPDRKNAVVLAMAIKEARQAKHMSQAELAALVGVSPRQIGLMENFRARDFKRPTQLIYDQLNKHLFNPSTVQLVPSGDNLNDVKQSEPTLSSATMEQLLEEIERRWVALRSAVK